MYVNGEQKLSGLVTKKPQQLIGYRFFCYNTLSISILYQFIRNISQTADYFLALSNNCQNKLRFQWAELIKQFWHVAICGCFYNLTVSWIMQGKTVQVHPLVAKMVHCNTRQHSHALKSTFSYIYVLDRLSITCANTSLLTWRSLLIQRSNFETPHTVSEFNQQRFKMEYVTLRCLKKAHLIRQLPPYAWSHSGETDIGVESFHEACYRGICVRVAVLIQCL